MSNKRRVAYAAYGAMLFINAFVDLGHKIVIQNTVFKVFDGQIQVMLTAIVNALMLLPFILMFSSAGFISDRFAKPLVMRRAAWLAVGLTSAITLCYAMGWFWPAFALTLLMAVQSTIYSPAKFGYIKELLGTDGLARGNAMVQAATTIAMLLGMLLYSAAFEAVLQSGATETGAILRQMWPLGVSLVLLSLMEAMLSRFLVMPVTGDPALRFDWPAYWRWQLLRRNLAGLRERPAIWWTIIGLSLFWALSQVVVATFPAYAKANLAITNVLVVQALLAASGIGIMAGSALAAYLSRHHIDTGLIPLGAIGMTLTLALVPVLDGPWAQGINFALFGLCGGLFTIPLNALMQYHAPVHESGRILAGNNFIQTLVMILFLAATIVLSALGVVPGVILWIMALVSAAGTVIAVRLYPHTLTRLFLVALLGRRYRLQTHGFAHIPPTGGVLLLGNHISWIDWALVQIASPRPIRFVMERDIYELWFLRWFFRIFSVIPISAERPRDALRTVGIALGHGEVVCLFPEGTISRNGQLAEFKRGYEMATRRGGDQTVIVPFYLHGMWGSRLSRACQRPEDARRGRRDLVVAFGPSLSTDCGPEVVKQAVVQLAAYCASIDRLQPALERLAAARVAHHGREPLAIPYGGAPVRRTDAWRQARALAGHWQRLPAGAIGVDLAPGGDVLVVAMATWLCGRPLVVASSQAQPPQPVVLWVTGPDVPPVAGGIHWRLTDLQQQSRGRYRGGRLRHPAQQAALWWQDAQGRWYAWNRQALVAQSRRFADLLQCDAGTPVMLAAQMATPLGLQMLAGGWCESWSLVMAPARPDPLLLARAIARSACEVLVADGVTLASLIDDERVTLLHLKSLNTVLVPDAADDALMQAWRARFASTVRCGWLHPAYGWLSLNVPDELDTRYWFVQQGEKPGSLGMAIPGVALREQNGEIEVAIPVAEDESLPCMADNRKVPVESLCWRATGRQGHVDGDGFVWLTAPHQQPQSPAEISS